jgi:hypothetical protein
LLRSYQGDISRLTDVCRQSIIFDRVMLTSSQMIPLFLFLN